MVAAHVCAGSVTQGLAGCRKGHQPKRSALCTWRRISCTAIREKKEKIHLSNRGLILGKVQIPMLWASSAHAEDLKEAVEGAATSATQATSGPPTVLGLNLFEVLLLAAPPVLYLAFNIYRSQVNQQAKLVDFVSILAAIVIFGNIFSVLVFKVQRTIQFMARRYGCTRYGGLSMDMPQNKGPGARAAAAGEAVEMAKE